MEKTINEVFYHRTQKYQDRVAVEKKRHGQWESATWNEYYQRARTVGLALYDIGIKKGDRVALLSENRLEWLYTDMGVLGIGGCVVPIYTTLLADEIEYIVQHSGAKVIVVEDRQQLNKVLGLIEKCPSLERIVVIEKDDIYEPHYFLTPFDALMEQGQQLFSSNPARFETLASDVNPEDLATIVYTSGTTGTPKGAMVTHKNIMAVIHSLDAIRPRYATDQDNSVPFLPLSHVFERAAGHFYGMYVGVTASYAGGINTILDDFKEKRPTIVLAVPRVCEKVYQRILARVKSQPFLQQQMFYWGQKIGIKMSEYREKKQTPPLLLQAKYKFVYELIFKKLNEALGGRVRWMTASGAPTSRDILLFFNAAGIMVIEGYGMTECFAPATMSRLDDYKIGTVGKPLPNVDIKIDTDGEILVKGENVFTGYWKLEEATKEAFNEQGYFKTGDIGQFDEDGFLMITDRKKDLIITSGGKNIAPQKIEGIFKFDPLFSNMIVIGERKKFLSALLTINLEEASRLASDHAISFTTPEALLEDSSFLKIVDRHVQERNNLLARFETIKKYKIIKQEFTQDRGELTASMKMKRNIIVQRYQYLIDEMYEGE
ncbi:MAG: long-chain fatty acid--CoA ligase [Desulfobacterales bacterium]|nr:long-chain fatty acid--CoA ligase [Desulfobacterales bacterium]